MFTAGRSEGALQCLLQPARCFPWEECAAFVALETGLYMMLVMEVSVAQDVEGTGFGTRCSDKGQNVLQVSMNRAVHLSYHHMSPIIRVLQCWIVTQALNVFDLS